MELLNGLVYSRNGFSKGGWEPVEIKLEVSSITTDLVCWALILYTLGAFDTAGALTSSYVQLTDMKGLKLRIT